MATMLNSDLLNGGSAGLWATATATADAVPTGTGVRQAYTAGSALALSEASAGAERTAHASAAPMDSEATSSSAGIRQARTAAQASARVESQGTADRVAWMAASEAVAAATRSATPVRWRQVGATATGEATAALDDLTLQVFRITRVRDTRGVALTSVREDRIWDVTVNQVYLTTDTGFARATAYGLANTAIGQGRMAAEAEISSAPLQVNLRRAAQGSAAVSATAALAPQRVTVSQSAPVGRASLFLSPTVTRAADPDHPQHYISAAPHGEASIAPVDGLSIRRLEPVAVDGAATTTVDEAAAYFMRLVESVPTPFAAAFDANERVRINPWKYAVGAPSGRAGSTSQLRHLAWVGVEARADAEAADHAVATLLRWVGVQSALYAGEGDGVAQGTAVRRSRGESQATATTAQAEAERTAWLGAAAAGVGALAASATVYRWRYATGITAGVASNRRADALRPVTVVPVKPIRGEAAIGRLSFKINAGDDAPTERTLYLPAALREVAIPYQSREYRIS